MDDGPSSNHKPAETDKSNGSKEQDIQPLDGEDAQCQSSGDNEDDDVCCILVAHFKVSDLENLIFFMKTQKLPISMHYEYLASFISIADFFTLRLRCAHFERYFERYPKLIPFAVFDEWRSLNTFTIGNRHELKAAIKRHRIRYRSISVSEKTQITAKIQLCLQRIITFWLNDYDSIDIVDLCGHKNVKIRAEGDGSDDRGRRGVDRLDRGDKSGGQRMATNNGQTITIRNGVHLRDGTVRRGGDR